MSEFTSTERPSAGQTGLIVHPLERADPRLTLDESALVAASRNAFPVVAQRQRRGDGAGLAAGVAIAAVLGGITFWSMSNHRVVPPLRQAVVAQAPRTVPVIAPTPAPPLFAPARAPLLTPAPTLAGPPPQVLTSGPAPMLVYDTGDGSRTASAPARPGVAAATAPTPPRVIGTGDNDQFAARVGGDNGTEVASARRLSDPGTTITQGTLIAAVLETAINTDLPGYVRAVVSQDVRSFDGSRVLVPRSSRLIGQYKSGLAAGQSRAYVIWTRLIRPDGVSVALGSPGTDFAGRSGLEGKVDSHFMQRFGSAVLLSVVGGLAAVGNSAVVVSGGQSAAAVAAQRDTQIPPTVRVPQGQPIRIFTARDLDFSSVSTGPQDRANG